jgi:hypothetical protein
MSEQITLEYIKNIIDNSDDINDVLIVNKYVSIELKQFIVDGIINACLEQNENGVYFVNNFVKEICLSLSFIGNYTNINLEIEEDNVFSYNFLKQNKIFEHIFKDEDVQEEFWFIEDLLRNELRQKIKIENSIESSVNKFLSKLIDKIPNEKQFDKFIKKIEKSLKGVSPEAINSVKEFVNKIK